LEPSQLASVRCLCPASASARETPTASKPWRRSHAS